MYIAAFEIVRRQCDAGELIEDIRPILNPEAIVPVDETDEKWYRDHYQLKRLVNPAAPTSFGKFLYYKRPDLLLVEMPALEKLLVTKPVPK